MNNIICPSELPVERCIERLLQIVSHLKTTYNRPMITITGFPRDPSIGNKAKLAGADFFFLLPFTVEDFEDAIKKCLDTIS